MYVRTIPCSKVYGHSGSTTGESATHPTFRRLAGVGFLRRNPIAYANVTSGVTFVCTSEGISRRDLTGTPLHQFGCRASLDRMSSERIAVQKRNGRLTPAAAEGEGPAEIIATSSDNPLEISHGLHENLCSLDIQLVQNLVERCLQLYMNQREVVCILQKQAKIDPGFTALVWQKLEEQNPSFFEAYHARLRIQDQMIVFNQLVQRHFFLLPRVSPELPNYH